MPEKYLMLDLDDERIRKIADVISNKTAKKILDLLAEGNLSETDIASKLGMPLNTVEYNLKKLEEVGLVEKAKEFFWSTRGKKIPTYKLSKKSIVISTKRKIPSILPSLIVTFLAAIGIKIYSSLTAIKETAQNLETETVLKAAESAGAAPQAAGGIAESAVETAAETATQVSQISQAIPEIALWFLLGGLVAIFIFLIWNYRRMR